MYSELRGSIPKLPFAFAKTLINRAWGDVRQANLWSFNLFESAWATPPLINSGTVTVTQGSPNIQFDLVVAVPAINAAQIASPWSLITQRQFRVAVGGIYNIISYSPSTGAAILDRMYMDPSGTGQAYQIYQVYYTPPMQDHLGFFTVRNPQMFLDLDLTTTRSEIDARDPQRSWYQFPTHVLPYEIDTRGQGTANASSTLGFPMFELWGVPVNLFTYQCYGIRKGANLVNPTDTLPVQVNEDTVLAKAYAYAYEWAEANKGELPRNAGPNFQFLIGQTNDKYDKFLKRDRRNDKENFNNWFTVRAPGLAARAYGYYNTLAGVAGPYSQY
jgi:hypothetical protein